MQPYSYHRLAKHTIRLLGLQDTTSPTFSGTLKTFNLSEAPGYYCLSYTWGTQSEDVEIHIDKQKLFVRPSLVDTLHRLQDLAANGSSSDLKVEWVWIDRICVNQDDVEERSEQVKYMGTIYSQGIRTIIWAGNDQDGCTAAWELIDQIYDLCLSENPQAKYLADIPLRMYSDQNHEKSRLPPWNDKLWEHLRRLFTLPWFTRTWIIQEVALSAKDPVILHGKHMHSWERLGWSASWLRRNGYLRLSQIPDQLQNCDTISNIRRSRELWRLDALIATTSVKFKSSDQRDKIYGLLGLAAENRGIGGLPIALSPDYKLEVWEVYTKVVIYFLREYRSLSMLTMASGIWGDKARAQHTYQYPLLPSWVPNWSDCCVSNSEHTKGFSWLFYSATGDATRLGFPEHSDASAGLPATILDSCHESVLRLNGLSADSIVSAVPFNEESQVTEQESILTAWKLAVQSPCKTKASERIVSFIKASTAEQHRLSGRSAEQIQADGAAYLLNILAMDILQEKETVSQSGNQEMLEALKTISNGGDQASYLSLARNFCHNRSFVVTENGRVGIGPLGTRPGDLVAVIFGGGVPYIIRQEGSSFLVVGETYIYGLMSGEAIEEWRKGQLEEKALEFR
ncbi:HET domain-containing protein [Paraphoma chrysanthemicola]|uniref:HET domain-containing protein n=1 Tax=Paraphoma chrysanthemicola TaxID=798071 RepID=A0A8K0VZY3_9PLEO|nr:HET domain-containing protein [Paraphoma chrysanthemicola]